MQRWPPMRRPMSVCARAGNPNGEISRRHVSKPSPRRVDFGRSPELGYLGLGETVVTPGCIWSDRHGR